MRRLQLGRGDAVMRARRWDAIVLGGALPGLVAAVRLGQRGHRVLVVEEETAARLPASMREPFWLGPAGGSGLVDDCLAALKVGLRDRRRIEPDPIAYQVVLPDARVDVGEPRRSVEELVSWGLAKPEVAREWVQTLAQAADQEHAALRELPLVRRGGLRGLARGRGGTASDDAVERAAQRVAQAAPPLSRFARAQLRALANVAGDELPASATVRLLGGALRGGGSFRTGEVTLRRLLHRRIQELHGELRSVRSFEFVSVDPHPGIAQPASREVWLGRALLLNAPRGLIAAALREADQPVPGFLDAPIPPRRRVALDLRCDPRVMPECMARRVLRIVEEGPEGRPCVVTLAQTPGAAAHEAIQLTARVAVDRDTDAETARAVLRGAVQSLVPFSSGRILLREHATPAWDDEEALLEPPPGTQWPPDANLRLVARRPVFDLPREEVAALGTEGDLLLGWRAGDAISEELG
jgi:hypothetical protein